MNDTTEIKQGALDLFHRLGCYGTRDGRIVKALLSELAEAEAQAPAAPAPAPVPAAGGDGAGGLTGNEEHGTI